MAGDLHTTFGHRPIYICGEAAPFIPNSSFLIPHLGRAFIHNQGTAHQRLTRALPSVRSGAFAPPDLSHEGSAPWCRR